MTENTWYQWLCHFESKGMWRNMFVCSLQTKQALKSPLFDYSYWPSQLKLQHKMASVGRDSKYSRRSRSPDRRRDRDDKDLSRDSFPDRTDSRIKARDKDIDHDRDRGHHRSRSRSRSPRSRPSRRDHSRSRSPRRRSRSPRNKDKDRRKRPRSRSRSRSRSVSSDGSESDDHKRHKRKKDKHRKRSRSRERKEKKEKKKEKKVTKLRLIGNCCWYMLPRKRRALLLAHSGESMVLSVTQSEFLFVWTLFQKLTCCHSQVSISKHKNSELGYWKSAKSTQNLSLKTKRRKNFQSL